MFSSSFCSLFSSIFFFFNDTATTEIYTLSLHDALPISPTRARTPGSSTPRDQAPRRPPERSEEHTSELQSPDHLVCRLLLEKKKNVPGRVPFRLRQGGPQRDVCLHP